MFCLAVNEESVLICLFSQRGSIFDSRALNPYFRAQQREAEAEPEGNAKEFMRRESSRRKERSDDWARRSDPASNATGPDHPFAVLGNEDMPDIPKSKTKK